MEGEGKADDDIVLTILTDAEEGEKRKREKEEREGIERRKKRKIDRASMHDAKYGRYTQYTELVERRSAEEQKYPETIPTDRIDCGVGVYVYSDGLSVRQTTTPFDRHKERDVRRQVPVHDHQCPVDQRDAAKSDHRGVAGKRE